MGVRWRFLMADLEVLTIGRVSVDLYGEQINAGATEVQTFRKSIGGTSTNVAVAAARLGNTVGTWTKVGDDEFGAYVRHALVETFGVDATYVGTDASLNTPLAFAILDPPDDPRIIFYREPRAPDLNLRIGEVPDDLLRTVPILWIPASRFADPASLEVMRHVLDVRGQGRHTILDLDWRPHFWDSEAAGTAVIGPLLSQFTVVLGNRAECRVAVGSDDPDTAADRMLDLGLETAIVKLGAGGVMVATAEGVRERIEAFPIEPVCGLGAGDAFGGALCHGLLAGWDLVDTVRFGNAAGAIVASRLVCADAMPTSEEVEAVLAGR